MKISIKYDTKLLKQRIEGEKLVEERGHRNIERKLTGIRQKRGDLKRTMQKENRTKMMP